MTNGAARLTRGCMRTLQSALSGCGSLCYAVQHHFLPGPHFQPITAVGGLQEEHIVTRQAQDALHWRRDVLVEAVWKLDHDDRPVTRCSDEPSRDDATTFAPEFPQHHVHENEASTGPTVGKGYFVDVSGLSRVRGVVELVR